jgi:N-methylhydantoinase B
MIDPITFEVLRHRLATIVDEGAAVLRNISGSPSVAQSNDCNVALLTAEGEGVIIGRGIASHAMSCIQTTKYVRKTYQDNPGIGPGDMFFSNHPYIGTPHQTCGVMVAPIFAGNRLIAWSGAGVHFGDVGGCEPGQVSIGARSIWDEAIPVPPIKIVENGVLRRDLEDEFLTRSRTRMQNAVDLKSMIGAHHSIKNRIMEMVPRYGTDTVVEALDRVIEISEAKLRSILREIPDGQWSCENYLDYYDEDRMKIYACRLTLTKERDSLVFDFTESSPQAPAVVNATFGATEGYILRAMLGILGFAVAHCPAALQRIMRIDAKEGTVVHCAWPAGVCKGTTSVTQSVWQVATHCLGQMLLTSEKYAPRAIAVSRGHLILTDILGKDQYGAQFAAVIQECGLAAGSGAGAATDGIDTGGVTEPEVAIPNVENNEFRYPILYLYRRQRIDSEGPGKLRGGLGLSMAYMPHDVAEISDVMIHTHGVTFPSASGLSGGYPAAINRLLIKRNTNIAELFKRGVLPGEMSEIAAQTEETPPPFVHSRLESGDIFECSGGGGGGFGDPLDRAPERVVTDVARGLISREAAATRYGVVVSADTASFDHAATTVNRAEIKAKRRASSQPPRRAPASIGAEPAPAIACITDQLSIVQGPLGPMVRCRCGCELCGAADSYRDYLAIREVVSQTHPLGPERKTPSFVMREYFCPNCWTNIETEVAMSETEVPSESRADGGTVRRRRATA